MYKFDINCSWDPESKRMTVIGKVLQKGGIIVVLGPAKTYSAIHSRDDFGTAMEDYLIEIQDILKEEKNESKTV